MTEQEKREAIKEFFLAPMPLRATSSIVAGSVIGIIGLLIAGGGSAGTGILVIAVGVLWAVFVPFQPKDKPGVNQESSPTKMFSVVRFEAAKARYENRPELKQMWAWLNEDASRIVRESKEHLNINEGTRAPIPVYGPIYFERVDGIDNALVLRRDVDGGYFYSTYRISVFHFTDKFLGSYQANYNMIKNVATSQQTDEFYYKDVVAVRTQTKDSNYTLKSGEKLEESKTFSLAVSSGDHVSVIINDPKIKVGSEIESIGDHAVNNIRAMLRQFKEQTV